MTRLHKYTMASSKWCYSAPELLLTDKTWRDMLQSPVHKEHLIGFIVDEAHCVKKWQLCNTLTSLKVFCL